jgi:hypothetical protein
LAGRRPQTQQTTDTIVDPQDPTKSISVRNVFDAQGNLVNQVPIGQVPQAAPTAAQQISQKKLDLINQIEAIPSSERTIEQRESLKKMLVGGPAVQVNLGKPASASERTAIAETEATLDSLDNLENLFNSLETQTGPVVGRIAPAKGLLGLTTENQESLMAASSAFENKVIKDTTGAQMSEKEAQRILKQVPRMTDPPARWKAKLAQTRRNMKLIQKRRSEVLEKSGITSPLASPIDVTQQQVSSPTTQAEFDAIPSGAQFVDTDGVRKVKQ